ncbi:hypothetical protein D0Z03_002744 [Geotrichum reessii]|nr:hypothetical protein D0Z03_002744 [Galactomyces reessii]
MDDFLTQQQQTPTQPKKKSGKNRRKSTKNPEWAIKDELPSSSTSNSPCADDKLSDATLNKGFATDFVGNVSATEQFETWKKFQQQKKQQTLDTTGIASSPHSEFAIFDDDDDDVIVGSYNSNRSIDHDECGELPQLPIIPQPSNYIPMRRRSSNHEEIIWSSSPNSSQFVLKSNNQTSSKFQSIFNSSASSPPKQTQPQTLNNMNNLTPHRSSSRPNSFTSISSSNGSSVSYWPTTPTGPILSSSPLNASSYRTTPELLAPTSTLNNAAVTATGNAATSVSPIIKSSTTPTTGGSPTPNPSITSHLTPNLALVGFGIPYGQTPKFQSEYLRHITSFKSFSTST